MLLQNKIGQGEFPPPQIKNPWNFGGSSHPTPKTLNTPGSLYETAS